MHEILKRYFGYSEFYPMQEDIINEVMHGKDVFVLMPTGSGKSLCYQLPAVMKTGTTIVISPLIALMKDQVDSLRANGIGASFINSTLSLREIEDTKVRLLENIDKILYVAPERLASYDFIPFLNLLNISLFAIDEAHCISEWGHDFRPEYRRLRLLKENFPAVPVMALTATAVPSVQKDIVEQLGLEEPKIFKASFNRENLSYYVRPKEDAYQQIIDYMKKRLKESGIIYCQSRQMAENLAERLCMDGFRALPYHAGLPSEVRNENQNRFIHDDVEIIVATIAFGMGINKTNIRYVIHYDMPKNLESYYQETGRAGRDRMESDCILFFSYGDKVKIEHFIEKKKNPQRKQIAYKKLSEMVNFCESTECRRKVLLNYFGESYEDRCGKCDTCLNPRETFDGTAIAKKVLGCIVEVKQRFGTNYIITILAGKESKRIALYSHSSLKSYGSGKEYTAKQWQSFIRELIRCGFIGVDAGKYPILRLNSKSMGVLSGRIPVLLTKQETRALQRDVSTIDTALFDILRALRKNIADAERVPPYVVFHDTTLKEMATYYPQDMKSLKKIIGVGQVKLERYGELFLDKLIDYCRVHNIASEEADKRAYTIGQIQKEINTPQHSDTYVKTLELCRQGLTLEQIAKTRKLATSTIASHIEKLLLAGKDISIDNFVSIEKQRIIQGCMQTVGEKLSPIKEKLGEGYSYNEIRLVRAKSNAEKNLNK